MNIRNVLYIGIDIGDRTYSVDAVKSSSSETYPVQLPGQKGNEPILSAVGQRKDGKYELLRAEGEYDALEFSKVLVNFKRCPSALSPITENSPRKNGGIAVKAAKIFSKLLRIQSESGLDSGEEANYAAGVREMLNLTLADPSTRQTVIDLSNGCLEIVFCVGYPTNWSKKDVSQFWKIINQSLLGDNAGLEKMYGKPVRVKLERESTAAFIYARSNHKELGIGSNTCVLVLDFGSSTVNVTALKISAKNTLYNSGHNFFGGRMVDCLIADYYVTQIPDADRKIMEDLDKFNDHVATSLILMAACAAKEKLGTSSSTRIMTSFSSAVKITGETLEKLLDVPLAPVVRRFHLIPDAQADAFGDKSWREILTGYLLKEKEAFGQAGIYPDLVIITGGGSMLKDVRKTCASLFQNVKFLDASDTTRTISKGLALAARREDKSAEFDQDVKEFLDKKMLTLVKAEIPTLAEEVSGSIADYLCDNVIVPRMLHWRDAWSGYETLDITSKKIAEFCTSQDFIRGIQKNPDIQKKIENWSINKLGRSIAGELTLICNKYKVKGFTIEKLNVMKMPAINVDGSVAIGSIFDALTKLVGVIAGFIAAALSADALFLVLSVIALFLPELSVVIAEIIAMIPGGLIILAAIAGVAVFKLVTQGWESVKEEIVANISGADIPALFRKAVTENKIKSSINSKRNEIKKKIKDSISSSENADDIARQIKDTVSAQVSIKLEEIRYAVESA